jgi:sugar-phosphatase
MWAQQHSLDVNEILKISHGRPTVETVRIVAPHLCAEAEAKQLDQSEAEDMSGVFGVDGAANLLASLPPMNWAVVTSGNRAVATNRLRHTSLPLPQVLVTADDVKQGKPHPEGYLKAASQLGVAPEHCVVIEDALAGIQAARAANICVIAVATTYPATELSASDICVPSLLDISISQVNPFSSDAACLEIVASDR